MKSYLNDVNASDVNRTNPAILPKERQAQPPMLEIFIVLNGKDAEKGEGKVAEGRGGRNKLFFCFGFFLLYIFFWENNKGLGLPPKKRLF